MTRSQCFSVTQTSPALISRSIATSITTNSNSSNSSNSPNLPPALAAMIVTARATPLALSPHPRTRWPSPSATSLKCHPRSIHPAHRTIWHHSIRVLRCNSGHSSSNRRSRHHYLRWKWGSTITLFSSSRTTFPRTRHPQLGLLSGVPREAPCADEIGQEKNADSFSPFPQHVFYEQS
jgi:hypothetical protein